VFAGLSLWALAKALHGEADPHAADGLPGSDGALAGEAVVTTDAKFAAIFFDRVLAQCDYCGADHRLHHAAAAV